MNRGFSRKISVADALFLRAIGFYQRQISPRKGWRCAHSVLHGGTGCSGAIRELIQEHGWRKARFLAAQRFRECALARDVLRAQTGKEDAKKSRRAGSRKGHWTDWLPDIHSCNCANLAFDCGPGDTGCCDCTPCS